MREKKLKRSLPTWVSRAAIGLSIAGVVSGGALVVGQAIVPTYEYCFETETPPNAIGEFANAQFQRDFGLVPLGFGCSWVMPDDTIAFEPTSNLAPTFLVYGGLLVGFFSGMSALSKRDVEAIRRADSR